MTLGVIGAVFLFPASAPALAAQRQRASSPPTCNDNWKGGGGLWSDAGNWSAGLPSVNSVVCITAPGSYTVSVAGLVNIRSFTLGAGSGNQTLAIDSTKTVESEFEIAANSDIKRNGSLVLDSSGSYAATIGGSAGAVIANSGSVATSGSYQAEISCDLSNEPGGAVTLGDAITETTSFTIENDSRFSVLKGATYEMDGTVFVQDGGTITNGGSMSDSGGGSAFEEKGGAATGNAIQLDGFVTFSDAAGSGAFILEGANSMSGTVPSHQIVTILATAARETATNFASAVTNNGTLVVDSTVAASSDSLGGAPLTNRGKLVVASVGTGDEIGVKLTNKLGATIDVTGIGGLNNEPVVNDGSLLVEKGATVALNSSASLTDGPASLTSVTIVASGGRSSSVTGGTIALAGTLRATTFGEPKLEAAYHPISSTKLSGRFAHLALRNEYKVTYLASALTLTASR
jgi:fibronectin-binding autotransporter adhesin